MAIVLCAVLAAVLGARLGPAGTRRLLAAAVAAAAGLLAARGYLVCIGALAFDAAVCTGIAVLWLRRRVVPGGVR